MKICPWWASRENAHIKYKKGLFWHKIHTYSYDCVDDWYYWVPAVFHISNVERVMGEFKTIQDIEKYEFLKKKVMDENNARISRINTENRLKQDAIYKKFR